MIATFKVPPPTMRGLPADVPLGIDEGEMCLRSHGVERPCLATIEYMPDTNLGSCDCFTMRMPPCSYCISTMPECPSCGWRMEL
jgi:hypothetical protein